MFKSPLETDRLFLRHFTMGDLDDIHRIMDLDPRVQRPEYRLTLDDRRDRLHYNVMRSRLDPGFGYRAVVLKESGRLIGRCGLSSYLAHYIQAEDGRYLDDPCIPVEVELGYDLASDHWGRGYATEAARKMVDYAFEELRLRRIVSITGDDNRRSIALMKRLGMTITSNFHPDWPGGIIGILANDRL